MDKSIHVLVQGLVQGVGYRAFTQAQAKGLGLRGWVKNRPDGSVELVAQGDSAQLDQLVASLKQGPSYSKVDRVSVKDHPETEVFSQFEVRY